MSFWFTIIGLASKLFSFFGKAVEYFKESRLIQLGKNQKSAEIIIKEDEIRDKHIEIIMKPETKEETTKKLDDGKF
jgi:hypothetical protein